MVSPAPLGRTLCSSPPTEAFPETTALLCTACAHVRLLCSVGQLSPQPTIWCVHTHIYITPSPANSIPSWKGEGRGRWCTGTQSTFLSPCCCQYVAKLSQALTWDIVLHMAGPDFPELSAGMLKLKLSCCGEKGKGK